jgi:WD40 repeat protein
MFCFAEKKFDSEVSCMSWDNSKQFLYCGQDNGNIYIWKLVDQEEQTPQMRDTTKDEADLDEEALLQKWREK